MKALYAIFKNCSVKFLGTFDCSSSRLPVLIGRLHTLLDEGIFCPPKSTIVFSKAKFSVDGYDFFFTTNFRVVKNIVVIPVKDLTNGMSVYGLFELADLEEDLENENS